MAAPRLALEALEHRLVPVTWGNPWPSAGPLTVSFVPDGTSTGGQPSNLFQALQAQYSSDSWRYDILRALQTWALNANINFGVVADGGQPLGAAGRPQGDPRFGDLRISAQPFTSEVYALSSPFDPLAGTWSGDIRINSNVAFAGGSIGGVPPPNPQPVDLYTTILQEAGHTLGLSNSDDPTSVMFETYEGARVGLGAEDIARIQALYGARQPDLYEGAGGNDTFASATPLTGVTNSDGIVSWRVPRADLTTTGDVDVYQVQSPVMVGGMIVRLERTGTSLVTPRVSVYDHARHLVATTQSTDPLSGDLTIQLDYVSPNKAYYIKVEGAGGDVFDVGAYKLRVQSLPWFSTVDDFLPDSPTPSELPRDDDHSNDTFATAEALPAGAAQASGQVGYTLTAKLREASDVDYYSVPAPAGTDGSHELTVLAWGVANGGLQPRVQVFDAAQNPVAGRALVNADGVLGFQIDAFVPGQTYVVRVDADGVGDYTLSLNFNAPAVSLDPWADRSLTASHSQETGSLDVHKTGLFRFQLEGDGAAPNAVALTIYGAGGQVVAQLTAPAGGASSVTLTLGPGTYTFAIAGQASGGTAFTGVNYRLRASRLSDPIGPQVDDPTGDPSSPPPPPPGNPSESWFYSWDAPAP